MRINVPVRATGSSATLIERVNADRKLQGLVARSM